MWLIVGYGNTLREDDGAGFRLAALLAAEISPHKARVLTLHQLTPELTLNLAHDDIDRVLFIDACRGQSKPLTMCRLDPFAAVGSCSHYLAPDVLLHMTHCLYDRTPSGWLLTLTAQRMGVGVTLSEGTTSAMSQAFALIKKLVDLDSPSTN